MTLPENSRYVILKHTTAKEVHFDFMLESEGVLSTWRISVRPDDLKTTPARAEKIFDHPIKFLSYEGAVNKGTGNVTTADKGTYSIISKTGEMLQIQIKAKILSGTYTLIKITKRIWEITPV